MIVRVHIGSKITTSDSGAVTIEAPEYYDGKDEGGYYLLEPAPDPPQEYAKRMERCKGCSEDFYNGRANIEKRFWCWHVEDAPNFPDDLTRKPTCFRRRMY